MQEDDKIGWGQIRGQHMWCVWCGVSGCVVTGSFELFMLGWTRQLEADGGCGLVDWGLRFVYFGGRVESDGAGAGQKKKKR